MQCNAFRRVHGADLAYVHNVVTSGTPIVFLHGFSDMAECWYGLINRLDLELPMYALDAPANGYSVVHATPMYTEQIAERAIAFIRRLGRPVILVGHSMGALQAMHIAGDAPELVKAAVLEDPPLAQDTSLWQSPAELSRLAAFVDSIKAQSYDEALRRIRESCPHWDDVEYDPWVRSKHLLDMSFVGDFRIHREPMETTLARMTCPTLLVYGDRDRGGIVDDATASWARSQCGTLQTFHAPAAGHNVHRDAPAPVADVVRSFVLAQA